jgi:hypothetical protein
MKKSAAATAFTLMLVFSIAATFHSTNGLDSVEEDSTKTTITLNETVEFCVDVNPASFIKWYCNDVLIQSDYATHSNYTFIPKSVGIYYIELSVDGFTKPSGPTKVAVVEQPVATPTPTQTPTPSFTHYYNDTHFALRQTLWAFGGIHTVGSFTATENDYLEFNIQTTNADPDRPDDVWVVEFTIESKNHNSSYVSGTSFNQEVKLNYNDTYTISFCKHPFFASVNIIGSIDLHRSAVAYPTPTQTPEPNNASTVTPTKNSSSQTPSELSQLLPTIILGTIGITIILLATAIYSKKRISQAPRTNNSHRKPTPNTAHSFFQKNQGMKK